MFGSFFGKPIVECLSVSRNSAFACDRDLLRKKRGGEEEDRFVTRGKERRRRETLKMLEQESDRDGSSSESQKLKSRKGMLLPCARVFGRKISPVYGHFLEEFYGIFSFS